MNTGTWSARLYLLNAALLMTHEIDSAYWQEWNLFGIPGGIQVFLVLNFVLVLLVLFGLQQLLQGKRAGYIFSLLLAAAGVFAFSIHSFFLLMGHPEFRLPISLVILGVTLLVSLIQGALAVYVLRAGPAKVPI